jgi:hypothetical protein
MGRYLCFWGLVAMGVVPESDNRRDAPLDGGLP